MSENTYPQDWPEIARRIKDQAGWLCERCKHPHDVASGHVLTVHHLDGHKANCADWNLAALCQRCHLRVQGRVKMEQLFMPAILPVSPWFQPHLAGYLASLGGPVIGEQFAREPSDLRPGAYRDTRRREAGCLKPFTPEAPGQAPLEASTPAQT